MRPTILGILLFLAALPGPAGAAQEKTPAPEQKPTFWIIPHTHWEGAVFKTREQYLEMGLPNILKALHLLETQPGYRFVLDQVAYVKPFIERYPEEAARLRKFVKEGRVELVLGMDVMPDLNLPGGETLLRQILYGKTYYREQFGVDVTVGWLIDTFGHNAQMPQILTSAGYTSFWSQRGARRPDHPSEFLWEGIDGSRIRTFLLPHTYALFHGAPRAPEPFAAFARQRWDVLTPHATGPNRVALSGADVSEPESALAPMVEQYNRQPGAPITLRLAVPSEFEAAAATHPGLSIVKGELNPIFRGTYSSRIELKQWMRVLEQKLTLGEKLAVLRSLVGDPSDGGALGRAWEPLFFNTAHDLASGVMTDGVYADTLRGYEYSDRVVDDFIAAAADAVVSRSDTSGEGVPLVVFNPLGWERSEVVEATLGFTGGVSGLGLVDAAGQEAPLQVLALTRYGDGSIQQASVAFLASRVPALGYATFRVIPKAGGAREPAVPETGDRLENEHYRLTVDPASGAITGLHANEGDWDVFRGPANVVAREEDKGDLWELYRGLDGAQKILVTEPQRVPQPGQAAFSSTAGAATSGKIRKGPVLSEFEVAHPFDDGSFATRVRIYAGSRRIDLRTELVNQRRHVRYRALFPTTIEGGRHWGSIPFGAIERADGVELPAQTWVDYGNGRRGVALLNVGLPGTMTAEGTLALSLARAQNLGAYGFGGGYEPGMSCETGFQIGKKLTLHYALVPHAGDWREAAVWRDGMELNHPLVVRKASPHPGAWPKRWGLLEIEPANVVLTTLKPGKGDSVILRVYEAAGLATPEARLRIHAPVEAVEETNLMEDRKLDLGADKETLVIPLKPFEIKTLKLRLRPPTFK
jgi:alpha-mannosidase